MLISLLLSNISYIDSESIPVSISFNNSFSTSSALDAPSVLPGADSPHPAIPSLIISTNKFLDYYWTFLATL